jgi:hypothetical protein
MDVGLSYYYFDFFVHLTAKNLLGVKEIYFTLMLYPVTSVNIWLLQVMYLIHGEGPGVMNPPCYFNGGNKQQKGL